MAYPPFDPNDPGCGPALIDVKTGRPLPKDDPSVVLGQKLWFDSPIDQRRAFYQFTAHFDRTPETMRLAGIFMENYQTALKAQKVQA